MCIVSVRAELVSEAVRKLASTTSYGSFGIYLLRTSSAFTWLTAAGAGVKLRRSAATFVEQWSQMGSCSPKILRLVDMFCFYVCLQALKPYRLEYEMAILNICFILCGALIRWNHLRLLRLFIIRISHFAAGRAPIWILYPPRHPLGCTYIRYFITWVKITITMSEFGQQLLDVVITTASIITLFNLRLILFAGIISITLLDGVNVPPNRVGIVKLAVHCLVKSCSSGFPSILTDRAVESPSSPNRSLVESGLAKMAHPKSVVLNFSWNLASCSPLIACQWSLTLPLYGIPVPSGHAWSCSVLGW